MLTSPKKNSEMRWHTVGTSRASHPPVDERPAGAGAPRTLAAQRATDARLPPVGAPASLASYPSRRCQHLPLSEALALQVETCLLLGRNGGVEAARDVPAKGAPEGVALADALGRTPAPKARRIVDAGDDAHGRSLRRTNHAEGARLFRP
jgi:hypothetical protein